jgi:hypothetical protein
MTTKVVAKQTSGAGSKGDIQSILQGRVTSFFNKKTAPTPLNLDAVANLGLTSLPKIPVSAPKPGVEGGSTFTAVIKDGSVYVNRTNSSLNGDQWFKLPGKAPNVPSPIRPTPTAVGGFGGGVAKPTPTAVPAAPPPPDGNWLTSKTAQPTPTAVQGHPGPIRPTPTAVGGHPGPLKPPKHGHPGPIRPTPTAVGGEPGGPVARPTPTAIPGQGGPVAKPTPTASPGNGGGFARPTPTAVPGDEDA